jgi:hypothetical protein
MGKLSEEYFMKPTDEEVFNQFFNSFYKELEAATAAQTPPPCTEILPEEALRYIDTIRKAAYEQGYNEGRMKGIEDVKNRIRSSLDL